MPLAAYSDTFQSYPCNYDWYQKLKAIRDTSRWSEYTVSILEPDTTKLKLVPISYSTTLMCKDIDACEDLDGKPRPVYTLTEISSNEEIDPLMIENKIPNCSFKFKDQTIDKNTPLDAINAKLTKYLTLTFALDVGYATYGSLALRDINGLPNLQLSDWTHDTVRFNYYKIVDANFDYETSTFIIDGEVLAFNYMSDSSAFRRDEVRFPEAYSWDKKNNKYSNGRYRTSISPGALLNCGRAANNYFESILLSIKAIGLYSNCGNVHILGPGESDQFGNRAEYVYGLNTWLQWRQTHVTTLNGRAYESEQYLYKEDAEPYSYRNLGLTVASTDTMDLTTSNIGYILSPLAYYLTKESLLDMYKEFSLYNDFWMLPLRKVGALALDSSSVTLDGTWHLIGGKIPNSDVFYDPSKTYTNDIFSTHDPTLPYDNGHYFATIANTKYKITPSMLLSSSVKRRELNTDTIQYVQTTHVPIETLGLFGGTATNNVTASLANNFIPFTGYRDDDNLVFPAPNPARARVYRYQMTTNRGFISPYFTRGEFPSDSMTPLEEGYFYDEIGGYVMASKEVSSYESSKYLLGRPDSTTANVYAAASACPDASVIVGHNLSIFSAYCNPRCMFWALNYETTLGDKAPITIQLPKVQPILTYLDKNDKAVIDVPNNAKTIQPKHAFTRSKGLCKRILDRVNGSHMNPLYILSWDMVDDPSLRVGTVVYVPLQNQYVKCFIYKQQREFNGGSKLSCEAWALEETNIPVLNPNPANATAVHRIVMPGSTADPKGEWLSFTWEPGEGFADLVGQNVIFGIYYKPHVGDEFLIYKNLYLSSDQYEALFNVPDLEAKLGRKLDLLGDDGTYYVKAYYASFGLTGQSDFEFFGTSFDNQPYSQVYVGEVEAQDTILPLMDNHWLRG